ncbi:MAG: Holliday junction branch migration protein RuvA [Lachnospiraceae bacterium]|nr:Holliday junction branch migration protein RuvA [Lachnospiraceae bacterium]
MIAYIKGVFAEADGNAVMIETAGGIAYEVAVMPTDLEKLPAEGEELKLYTYLQVKEDGVALYGFLSKADLTIFKLLITVSGIGPKLGLGILSSIGADELRAAVLSEDADRLAAAPGIGKKTAGRLVIELKDKIMALNLAFAEAFTENAATPKKSESEEAKKLRENALQVLVALGYAEKEAARAVKEVEMTEGMTDDDMVRLSLRQLG